MSSPVKHHTPKSPAGHIDPYEQVFIDEEVLGHWELVLPMVIEKQGTFKDPKLHAVFRQTRHHKRWGYWAQVKLGHQQHAAEWTVKFDIEGHHAHVESVEQGFKTYF